MATFGNIYAQKVGMEGYSPEQAMSYAALVAISQFGLQYLVGGISKLGGEWSKAALGSVAEKLNVLDSVFENIAFDLASAGLRQGAVGALQYCMEPIFSHWILDTELTPEQFEGWGGAFLQGAVMGMVFEGIDILASNTGGIDFFNMIVI